MLIILRINDTNANNISTNDNITEINNQINYMADWSASRRFAQSSPFFVRLTEAAVLIAV